MLTIQTVKDGNGLFNSGTFKLVLAVIATLVVSFIIYFVISFIDDLRGNSKDQLNLVINEQKAAIKELKEANELLSKTLEQEREQTKLREEHTQKTIAQINENYQKLLNNEKSKSDKIKSVSPRKVTTDTKNVNRVIINQPLTEQEAIKISTIQIDNIWENYHLAVKE